jgi:DNA-binding CsgD family transcriptional regulator
MVALRYTRLTGAGGRPTERTGAMAGPQWGWVSLTKGELCVAELVAEGMTNRQVAEKLCVSPHTVDFHLRQVFRKLDITNRVHLTRIVVEHSLVA